MLDIMGVYWSPDLPLYCHHHIVLSEVCYLFNIVNHTVKHPLNVNFNPPPQGESIHPFARSNVAENRLYNSQPLAVSATPLWRVYLPLHLISKAAGPFAIKYMNLPRHRFGIPQTFGTQWTITACCLRCLVSNGLVPIGNTEIPISYI